MKLEQNLLSAAAHWEHLADEELAMAIWQRQRGIDLTPAGQSVGENRAELYRRCARTLRLQAKTGVPHCMCHELPEAECPTLIAGLAHCSD